MKKSFLPFLLLSISAFAFHIPEAAWKTGVLQRVSADPVAPASVRGKKAMRHGYEMTYYFIQSGDYLYEGEILRKKKDKDFPVTVNAPVKFLLKDADLYLRDSKGKEHKLLLLNAIRSVDAGKEQPK
jgi:hypothetical protein